MKRFSFFNHCEPISSPVIAWQSLNFSLELTRYFVHLYPHSSPVIANHSFPSVIASLPKVGVAITYSIARTLCLYIPSLMPTSLYLSFFPTLTPAFPSLSLRDLLKASRGNHIHCCPHSSS